MSLAAALAFVLAHWSEILDALLAFGALASIVVGLLPRAARYAPVVGGLVRFLEWCSVLTHRDAVGTFKLPGFVAMVAEALRRAKAGESPPARRDEIPPPPRTPGGL